MRPPIRTALAAALALAPLAAPAQETMETFGGAWDSDWGEVWAWPTEAFPGWEGTYEEDNGRFVLEFTGHVYEGYWAEDMAGERCETDVLGSFYWGRLELGNSDSFPGFRMLWGYCDTGPLDKEWTFRERLPDGL